MKPRLPFCPEKNFSKNSHFDRIYFYYKTKCFICQYEISFYTILKFTRLKLSKKTSRDRKTRVMFMGDNRSRLRDLREDQDLSQSALAKYLNCSQACYSYYELGRRDIPTESLIRLAEFYDTSVDYLLGRTNVKRPYPQK